WVCCVATGALFATAHLQFDLSLFADRLLLGVVLAFLVVRTGGLEASIAVHLVKNVSVLIPAGLLGDVEDALDPGAVSWLPLIVDVVLLAIVVPWILYASRGLIRQDAPMSPGSPGTASV
ncbi:MAG: CPBP family intramembrane metalloprotease, partial [Propionibacteriales bacterium]|nr:CPBP family intramembrane metalloprotease [Propionibacteriales bacterium]